MNINIHSWNIRGMEMFDKKYLVRKWCNSLKNKDIIFLQEIKLVGKQDAYNLRLV